MKNPLIKGLLALSLLAGICWAGDNEIPQASKHKRPLLIQFAVTGTSGPVLIESPSQKTPNAYLILEGCTDGFSLRAVNNRLLEDVLFPDPTNQKDYHSDEEKDYDGYFEVSWATYKRIRQTHLFAKAGYGSGNTKYRNWQYEGPIVGLKLIQSTYSSSTQFFATATLMPAMNGNADGLGKVRGNGANFEVGVSLSKNFFVGYHWEDFKLTNSGQMNRVKSHGLFIGLMDLTFE